MYGARYGEAHLDVASHLALPLSLTPELAYSIWSYFRHDIVGEPLRLPWVAVPDLLLSGMCSEVGRELYEMDLKVRDVLLGRLIADPRFGQQRLSELGVFLFSYVDDMLESGDVDARDFASVQQLTAVAYSDPDEAARGLLLLLNSTSSSDLGEVNLWGTTIDALSSGSTGPIAAYPVLTTYARALELHARGDVVAAARTMRSAVGSSGAVEVAGLALTAPTEVTVPTREDRARKPPYRRPVKARTAMLLNLCSSRTRAEVEQEMVAVSDRLSTYGFATVTLNLEAEYPTTEEQIRSRTKGLNASDALVVIAVSDQVSTLGIASVSIGFGPHTISFPEILTHLRGRPGLRTVLIVCASTERMVGMRIDIASIVCRSEPGGGDVSVLTITFSTRRSLLSGLEVLVRAFSGEAVPHGATILTSADVGYFLRDELMQRRKRRPLDVTFVPGREVVPLAESISGSELIDDLDGGRADEVVEFSIDGLWWEINLSEQNAVRLRDIFADYVGGARRARDGRRR